MKLAEIIKEPLELAWWVEIVTEEPRCGYYFGPFASAESADLAQAGYVEDLAHEEAQGITVQVKWYKPRCLTICEDELAESFNGGIFPQ
jgi:Domain of unknown function (DUF1816)